MAGVQAHFIQSAQDLAPFVQSVARDHRNPLDQVVEGETMEERCTRASTTWAEGITSEHVYKDCLVGPRQSIFVPCKNNNYTWRLLDRNKNRNGWLDNKYLEDVRQIIERDGAEYCVVAFEDFIAAAAALENLVAFVNNQY